MVAVAATAHFQSNTLGMGFINDPAYESSVCRSCMMDVEEFVHDHGALDDFFSIDALARAPQRSTGTIAASSISVLVVLL